VRAQPDHCNTWHSAHTNRTFTLVCCLAQNKRLSGKEFEFRRHVFGPALLDVSDVHSVFTGDVKQYGNMTENVSMTEHGGAFVQLLLDRYIY